MTRDEQIALLTKYNERFSAWEAERTDGDRAEPVGIGRGVRHARYMMEEMLHRLENNEESSPGQADRWIGFIQSILWNHGIMSINDMIEDNITETPKGFHPDQQG